MTKNSRRFSTAFVISRFLREACEEGFFTGTAFCALAGIKSPVVTVYDGIKLEGEIYSYYYFKEPDKKLEAVVCAFEIEDI